MIRSRGCHGSRSLAASLLVATGLAAAPLSSVAEEMLSTPPEITVIRVGFDGYYKVGYWTPVEVVLRGGSKRQTGFVRLLLPDGDGVLTTVRTLDSHPVETQPDRETKVLLEAKFGRATGQLTVQFVSDGEIKAQRLLKSGPRRDPQRLQAGLQAIDELIVTVGPSVGLAEATAQSRWRLNAPITVVNVSDISCLPHHWYGYEGVDLIVLSTGQSNGLLLLSSDDPRIMAIGEWVELGGHLVLFVGTNAPQVLGQGSPLASLAPGKFDRMVTLRKARPLEVFCDATQPIESGRRTFRLQVPRLGKPSGNVEAYAGKVPHDLPLIIRSPRGFGEVVFVAVDPAEPPLRDWPDRGAFLRKILDDIEPRFQGNRDKLRHVDTLGYSDFSGQLRDAMDRFRRVKRVPFWVVIGLAAIYILVIGPLDYFLIKKWLKRPTWTWITFPAIVILSSGGIYAATYWLKGDRLGVNQVELVDVDMQSGLVRGTMWTRLFSPRSDFYNLRLQPRLPDGKVPEESQVLLSWMGLPGNGLGAMSSQTPDPWLSERPYAFSPELDELESVPVSIWSTKDFIARWVSSINEGIESQLVEVEDQMIAGEIINNVGTELVDGLILYQSWVYPLPRLKRGQLQIISDALQPCSIRTKFSHEPYDRRATDVGRIVDMMMFHEAVGGTKYTHLLQRYQDFCDLSGHLQLGRAIVVARSRKRGSQWLQDGAPLSGVQEESWTIYRFVLPVERKNVRHR